MTNSLATKTQVGNPAWARETAQPSLPGERNLVFRDLANCGILMMGSPNISFSQLVKGNAGSQGVTSHPAATIAIVDPCSVYVRFHLDGHLDAFGPDRRSPLCQLILMLGGQAHGFAKKSKHRTSQLPWSPLRVGSETILVYPGCFQHWVMYSSLFFETSHRVALVLCSVDPVHRHAAKGKLLMSLF